MYQELTAVDAIDLTTERVIAGDDNEFIEKMNRYMSKLEDYTTTLNARFGEINTLGNQLATAQDTDDAAIAALQLLVTTTLGTLNDFQKLGDAIENEVAARVASDIAQNSLADRVTQIEGGTFDAAAAQTAVNDLNAILATLGASPGIVNVTGLVDEFSYEQSQRINLLPYDGSFYDLSGANTVSLSKHTRRFTNGTEYPFLSRLMGEVLVGFNGMDLAAMTKAGEYVYDSSTYGGPNAVINSIAQAFSARMGMNARYAPGWAIGEVTSGTGTSSTSYTRGSNTYYRVFNSTYLGPASASRDWSLSFWIQASKAWHVAGTNANARSQVYVDGVRLGHDDGIGGGEDHVFSSGQVHFVCVTYRGTGIATGYVGTAIPMHFQHNTPIRFAMPALLDGAREVKEYMHCIRSLPPQLKDGATFD